MPEQRCVCGHAYSIHRPNSSLGNRNECWALNADPRQYGRWCNCRQYQPAAEGEP